MRNSRLARFRGEASLTWLLSWLVLAGHATPGSALEAVAALDFALRSEPVAHRNLEWLRGVLTAQQVQVLDPYERRRVTFDSDRRLCVQGAGGKLRIPRGSAGRTPRAARDSSATRSTSRRS